MRVKGETEAELIYQWRIYLIVCISNSCVFGVILNLVGGIIISFSTWQKDPIKAKLWTLFRSVADTGVKDLRSLPPTAEAFPPTAKAFGGGRGEDLASGCGATLGVATPLEKCLFFWFVLFGQAKKMSREIKGRDYQTAGIEDSQSVTNRSL